MKKDNKLELSASTVAFISCAQISCHLLSSWGKPRKTSARRPSDEGAVRIVIASNGVPFLQIRSVGSQRTSRREEEGKKERTGTLAFTNLHKCIHYTELFMDDLSPLAAYKLKWGQQSVGRPRSLMCCSAKWFLFISIITWNTISYFSYVICIKNILLRSLISGGRISLESRISHVYQT